MAKFSTNVFLAANSIEQLKTELQFVLQQFADRIDKLEGIRGTPEIKGKAAFTADIDIKSDMFVKDSDGNIIHSME